MNFFNESISNNIKAGDYYMKYTRMYDARKFKKDNLIFKGESFERYTYDTIYGEQLVVTTEYTDIEKWIDERAVNLYRQIRKDYIKALTNGKIQEDTQ